MDPVNQGKRAENCFLGLNKGDHHSSVCLLRWDGPEPDIEILLYERLKGVKNAGGWPMTALESLPPGYDYTRMPMAENSFGFDTKKTEEKWDENYLFFDILKRKNLTHFSPHFNPSLKFFTHHLCHAMSAALMSPFERCLILVQDGIGNEAGAFPEGHEEILHWGPPREPTQGPAPSLWAEALSVYAYEGGELSCVEKEWQHLRPFEFLIEGPCGDREDFSEGLGHFYGACTKFVFNSFHEAGKLMGLAPHGRPREISSRWEYLAQLDWERKRFRQKGKKAWEESGNFSLYADIAASAQRHFESSNFSLLESLKRRFPGFDNLILVGGCALNCVFNIQALERGIFSRVYVPPFPGDEGISLGAAGLILQEHRPRFQLPPRGMEFQTSSFGPRASVATEEKIRAIFAGMAIERPPRLAAAAAKLLSEGKILAWFQGRSESGPRALGHRSILGNPLHEGLKDHLNERVKCRESFRPYGPSCLWEKAHEYFEVPLGFDSPFMSFAPFVHGSFRDQLKEVMGPDGRSRVQTVRRGQNPRFHELITEFGKLTGLFCLLNTSLNRMGKPIVESLEDLFLFFQETPVDALVIEDFLVFKTPSRPH